MASRLKVSRIRVAFQVLLHAVLITHVLGYYFWGWTGIGGIDIQSFFHDFLGKGLLTAGAIFTLAAFLLTLILGRIFCSWGCHFGAFQDLSAWILRRLGWRPPFVRTRFLHWAPYALLLGIFVAPPLLDWLYRAEELRLRLDLAANAPWGALPGWIGSVVTFLACGAGILLFLGTRGFCRFICPYGASFRLLDPIAPYRVRRVKPCGGGEDPPAPEGAGSIPPCTRACPTAVAVHEETTAFGAVRDSNCIRCHLCIEACPQQALSYSFRPLPIPVLPSPAVPHGAAGGVQRPSYTMPLSRELLVAGVTLAAFIAWDLAIAAHFLAAALALGEGFLALLALETAARRDLRIGRLALRRNGRWTFAGVTAAGLFAVSLAPLAQGLAFKALRAGGDRAFDKVFPAASRDDAAWPDGVLAGGADLPPAERRGQLERAEEMYRRALSLLPGHLPTLRRRALVLAHGGDPRALEAARRLAAIDPDPGARALLSWVEGRFGGSPSQAKERAGGRSPPAPSPDPRLDNGDGDR